MTRLKRCGVLVVWLSGLIASSPGWSDESVPVGYRTVAEEQGIPPALLYAVALTESARPVGSPARVRPWPWTLNMAGRGVFFASRLAAWRALTVWLEEGKRSVDIGLMQVSWRYHERHLSTPWQALDPYHNLRVGAGILKACYQTRRGWWASVGCYHAPANSERAFRYRGRVASRWRRLVNAG